MTADDLIRLIEIRTSPKLRSLQKRIESGTATLRDSFEYSAAVAGIAGRVLSENIIGITPEERELICTALLRQNHREVNDIFAQVQENIDRRNGLTLRPRQGDFPAERVQQFAHSLVDPTVEESVIRRRARSGTENITLSFHDDSVRENAKFRNDAGLTCYLDRQTNGKCCPWCSDAAGRYLYGTEPRDIYRRHDNCNCTVIFESGRQRQNVWTKRSWEAPEVGSGNKPKVFSEDEARSIEQRNLSQIWGISVDNSGGSGIIESELGRFKETIRNDDRMSRDYYLAVKTKFSHGSDDAKALFNKCVKGDSVIDSEYIGTPHFDENDTKKIFMSYYADLHNSRGECVTWFHEHGHLIDDAMGKISNNAKFRQCLNDDWLSYMQSYGKANNIRTIDEIQTAISKDLSSMRKHSAVSDVLEGVSNGGITGCAGHGIAYWKDDSMICAEAFAHMYEAQFDKIRYAEMQKYFPSALSKFESMIKEAAK